jgi:K+-sensing histidine kinase KdpD
VTGRQIAESHGGRVEVEEAPGGGACFRLSLVAGTLARRSRVKEHPGALGAELGSR